MFSQRSRLEYKLICPCGSSSRGATGFSSESAERGLGVEAIDRTNSLGNRSQGIGKVVREGGLGFGPEAFEFVPEL